ncbi:hypothetical protein FRC09_013527 [Ceratobasidium sp. 395]|nr:hypothetical protein FRC09_013527 [Ceratobasidium sp. 395]
MLLPSARVPQAPSSRLQPCLFYNSNNTLRLPNEVWVHILECLPVPAILLCRQLCRKIKYIVDNTVRLQYPIELFATGNIDGGPSNPLSTASRLAQLREIDRGWRTLDWKSQRSEPWNGDCPNYELAGGVFARGRSTLPDASQLEVDDVHHFTAAIDVTVFPPRDGSACPVKWSHEQVGLLVHDFTIAPEQDLVVLVGHRHEGAIEEPIPIHLRTLSSNSPHPMATLPVLFAYPQPPDVFISDFTIQIYNSLLGILFWGAHAFHLMIWDWCTGELIVDYPAPAGIHFDDFSFLSSTSFLIPSSSATGAALRVYSFAHLLSPTNYHPLGRAPHHLEFDNAGRRVAPACWTQPRSDGIVRSFHIGNYVFCVSNLDEGARTESNGDPGPSSSYDSPTTAPAGLSGLSRRPELRSLLRFPKPKREWNVGIMTCRVDPLPRSGTIRPGSHPDIKGKGKGQDDDDDDEEWETRFAPARPFHADPDRAIIALSSGLVPVRGGVFAGVVYLDEQSLAWEEGAEDDTFGTGLGGGSGTVMGADDGTAGPNPFLSPLATPSAQPDPSSGGPPPLTTLVPWIDLHMPPSSLPTPAEPPLMSVFDHSSASSGHIPIQIQIHDALLGEETGTNTTIVYGGVHHHVHHHHHHHNHHHHHPPDITAPLTGPAAPVPAPFMGALPVPQAAEDQDQVVHDDMDRLYFNLFVHCRALRKFADADDQSSSSSGSNSSASSSTPILPPGFGTSFSSRVRPHRPRVYEWDDWAPPIARLLTRMPMPAWACISHGQRFATLGAPHSHASMSRLDQNQEGGWVDANESVNGTGAGNQNIIQAPNPPIDPNILLDGGPGGANVKRPVRVLDFNPYGVRRYKTKDKDVPGGNTKDVSAGGNNRNRVRVVDTESVLPAGKYWEKDVKSALPYREVVTQEELLLSGVMIDGERVLGMRSDERGNVSSMHVMQV